MSQTAQHLERTAGSLDRPADPFREDRQASGVRVGEFHGERMVQILRWKDVREAARDIARFDSGELGRVPIPPETGLRSFRQIPIETNPPEHTAWKALLQPYFRRPKEPEAAREITDIVQRHLSVALSRDDVELVSDFALPTQSHALAVLLDTDRDLAEDWIGWGLHAFRTDGKTDPAKSERFLDFIDAMLTRGETEDQGFFSYLHTARIGDRPLTRDEKRGICHLALSGGRDTIINSIVGVMAHFAARPDDLAFLRDDPARIPPATEEFFRVLSPLPQIGRVCSEGLETGGVTVRPGDRAALCWASANRDETVFDAASEIRLDRKKNPHVAFGAGAHTCLGAPLARLLVSTLLAELARSVDRIEILRATPRENGFGTPYLFHSLYARLHARGDTSGERSIR